MFLVMSVHWGGPMGPSLPHGVPHPHHMDLLQLVLMRFPHHMGSWNPSQYIYSSFFLIKQTSIFKSPR